MDKKETEAIKQSINELTQEVRSLKQSIEDMQSQKKATKTNQLLQEMMFMALPILLEAEKESKQ